MKNKYLFLLILLSFVVKLVGATMKILHWNYTTEVLTFGFFSFLIVLILIFWKIIISNKEKDNGVLE